VAPLEAAGLFATPYPRAWKQTKNGELLERAEGGGFDILITNDKNIYAQQNLRGRNLSIIVLPTNRRRQLWNVRRISSIRSIASNPDNTL
jgi:hypothetical protein